MGHECTHFWNWQEDGGGLPNEAGTLDNPQRRGLSRSGAPERLWTSKATCDKDRNEIWSQGGD